MVDFSKTTDGAVKIDFGGLGSNYIGNPKNVIISGRDNEIYEVNPIVKGPRVHITFEGGSFNYKLSEISIDGVTQTDLEDAKASLAVVFSGTV